MPRCSPCHSSGSLCPLDSSDIIAKNSALAGSPVSGFPSMRFLMAKSRNSPSRGAREFFCQKSRYHEGLRDTRLYPSFKNIPGCISYGFCPMVSTPPNSFFIPATSAFTRSLYCFSSPAKYSGSPISDRGICPSSCLTKRLPCPVLPSGKAKGIPGSPRATP